MSVPASAAPAWRHTQLLRTVRHIARNMRVYLARRRSEHGATPGRVAYVRFGERRPGRYDYALLRFLSLTGHDVVVQHHYRLLATHRDYGDLVFRIPRLRIGLRPPRAGALHVDLSGRRADGRAGRADDGAGRDRWQRRIVVDLDAFSPAARAAAHVPFPMHPLAYADDPEPRLARLRGRPRTIRVLFAGSQTAEAYGPASSAGFGLVSRRTMLDHLRASLGGSAIIEVHDGEALRALDGGDGLRVVLVDTDRCWIPRDRWLATLATADFFLAPPGVAMPFCHNIVEAMAVGTIPITEYGALFPTPLVHGRDCLAFSGTAGLTATVRDALALPPSRVAELRAGAARYYDEHLSPASFARRLAEGGDGHERIYMVAEHETLALRPPRGVRASARA